MTTLDAQAIELIGLAEKATEGSRELDDAIFNAIGATDGYEPSYPGLMYFQWRETEGGGRRPYHIIPPHYTTSLDAALTLVPENFRWVLASHSRDGLPVASVYYVRPGAAPATKFEPGVLRQSSHPVPALALCIAALKARAALHPQPDTTSEVM